MNVTFRQLRVFVEVARQGSVLRAAEALHLTPPAVSQQIKEVVGSGPFRFVRDEWNPGQRAVWARNDAYVPRQELSGRIALHEVAFSYPAAPGHEVPKVLKGVSLAFAPGKRVAILGKIGSGKSTVLRLLAGLYRPTEGLVEVDGIDLRQIDPADYRARVGFVSQDPRLFNGTLRDNVLLDRPAADPARLVEVARVTGLDRLIAAHPMGWELPVGEARLLGALAGGLAGAVWAALGLGDVETLARLEPLPVAVDQGHGGDRHVEDAARQARDAVERLLGRRVEDVVAVEGAQALLFAGNVGVGLGRHLKRVPADLST